MPDRPQSRPKLENFARILPFLGATLMLSPLAGYFARDVAVFGLPISVVYLFGLWLVLIFAAFAVSSRLRRADPPATDSADPHRP